MKHWLIILVLLSWVPNNLVAATFTIDNERLSVGFDTLSGHFFAEEKATGSRFLINGRLEGGFEKESIDHVIDPVFGAGQRITVTQVDGSVAYIELYKQLPFILIRKELHNNTPAIADFQKYIPVTFDLDLGKPANELRTMGTDGLTGPSG